MQKEKYLIVVDMQNDFVTGALPAEGAEMALANVVKRIEAADDNTRVLFTRDTHFDDYLQTQEGKHLPVPHCIEGTQGWQLVSVVEQAWRNNSQILKYDKRIGDVDNLSVHVYNKETFGSLELSQTINLLEDTIAEIELVGICTDICVISNAMLAKAAAPTVPVKVNAACCAGVSVASHNQALEAMKMCQIEVI